MQTTPCVNTQTLNRQIRLDGKFEDANEAFQSAVNEQHWDMKREIAPSNLPEEYVIEWLDDSYDHSVILGQIAKFLASPGNCLDANKALGQLHAILRDQLYNPEAVRRAAKAEPELAEAAGV